MPPTQATIYYAGQPGRLTQDRDRLGGNPFASALVEVLGKEPATLTEFTERLAAANARHSGGWQQLQFPKKLPKWKMDARADRKRVAAGADQFRLLEIARGVFVARRGF